jgi:uncharacterized protein YjbJ (UPF0337 family)
MADRNKDGTVGEELSAMGQRAKGEVKNAVGNMTGNSTMERSGERDIGESKIRQEYNNVLDKSDDDRSAWRGGFVSGMYNSPEHAQRAYDDLTTRHGYKPDEVSVLMSDESRKRYYGDVKPGTELDRGSKAAEGAGVGGGIGAGVGAALGALFAVGTSLVIPGLGLVVAGPIAAALAGAGAGGVTGGLIGAMVGAGIPEDRAAEYERGLKEGGIVIGTRARDEKHAADLQRDYTNWGGVQVMK